MTKIFTKLMLLSVLSFKLFAQEAGITNPVDGLVIHRYNQSTYISGTNDCAFDGWANPGNIGIKLYVNGSLRSLDCNNCGTWQVTQTVDPGTNDIYLESRKDLNPWVASDNRIITFVKPMYAGDFYCESNSSAGYIKVQWFKHTASGTEGFYYHVYRNTTDQSGSGSDWTPLGIWIQDDIYYDYTPVSGVIYYYWVVCATNNSGLYPSAFGTSNSARLPLPAYLTVTPSNQNVSNNAGTTSPFTISSNTTWTITDNATWLSTSIVSGVDNNTFTATFDENYTQNTRIATITISGNGVNPTDVTVAQDGVSILPDLYVQNETIVTGQAECYNATNTITVAGSGNTVDVQSGGEATFIAGNKIIFNPGFTSHLGSYSNAYITTTGDYCSQQPPMMAQTPTEIEESFIADAKEMASEDTDVQREINIYPNPTTGEFVIDFSGDETTAEISLHNYYGMTVYTTKIHHQKMEKIDISDLPGGIYIVVINTNSEKVIRKIVKTF